MDWRRFREIIQRNHQNEAEVEAALKEFKERKIWDGDIPKLMKEIGEKLGVFKIEIPMRDPDFGACFFKTPDGQYLLLNSSQPRCSMNFAFCHDIYHVLHGTPEHINEVREVHLNQDYLYHANEGRANLFAASLLMPETDFRTMAHHYGSHYPEADKQVAHLMHYFEAPFAAVLLRLYELKIWESADQAKELLEYDTRRIYTLFDECWLNRETLLPTMNDDFGRLMSLLAREGDKLNQNEIMSTYNHTRIMETIQTLYEQIRFNHD
ncbi:ImmA/IrrE family metallo-endopeptidase [Saccharibacillus sp. CPCC 101409]|uniref:ImmA/IrrE family metallo-endopeptidase n=1 Tax=Saccharibacillus sp. CPCC 101409 TaxID=3058041 RepID=UPI002671D2AD|nr:ImmA/IrrE family metallo-endopeptidase [Saccharibacillus sp. CPCC 101409]MDO3411355.1 ImmA/IrrE family metallo-endopeptidase [Saccharibacillus sp. CPCC 101409]